MANFACLTVVCVHKHQWKIDEKEIESETVINPFMPAQKDGHPYDRAMHSLDIDGFTNEVSQTPF